MKKLLLFLDYDGTLTPIVKKPHQAKLPNARRSFLKKISKDKNVIVTIVSGRMLSNLKEMVRIPKIFYIGNHGFEISGPKTKFVHHKALAAKPILREIKNELAKRLKGIKGIIIEDKILTLCLHYRLVSKKDFNKAEKIFKDITAPYLKSKKIRITHGKKVFEIRPNVRWDKGQAVLWFLNKKAPQQARGKRIFPVYIGDDTTDEDAFKVLKKRGVTFRVGRTTNTHAKHFLKNVDQVYALLEALALKFSVFNNNS